MIIEYKNSDGFIYAYISWNIINEENRLVDNGETISINGAWVHPKLRNRGVLKSMINDLFHHQTTQNSLYVLSCREKYKDRPTIKKPIYKYLKYITGDTDE